MSQSQRQAKVQWKQPENIRDLIMQALSNVNNSFNAMEMESYSLKGAGEASTHPSWARFTGNVMLLKNHVLEEIQDARYKAAVKDKNVFKEPEVFHEHIMELLNRQGMFNILVLRSLAK